MLKNLLPGHEIASNYWHPDYKLTDKPVQYDLFIPALSLAFEYNGQQHCI
jgi:hypothetical protein